MFGIGIFGERKRVVSKVISFMRFLLLGEKHTAKAQLITGCYLCPFCSDGIEILRCNYTDEDVTDCDDCPPPSCPLPKEPR